MLDFRARGFGFIPAKKTERELSLKEQLVERLEERFRKHQASLRVLTVSGLAMALSACKDDALVQGSDGNDVLGNTPEDQIFRGRLGNDVYSYLLAGTDKITDTGGTDELRVSVVDSEGVSIQTSFKRVGDDLVVTQSGEGNSVTVEGAFVAGTALEAVTLVYEDGNIVDKEFYLVGDDGVVSSSKTNMFIGTDASEDTGADHPYNGWFFAAGGNDTIVVPTGSNTIHGGNGDDVITLGDGDDKVFAGAGNDTIHAGLGSNEVYAQAGNDIVLAAGGDDLIVGGTGDDVLSGGEGYDEFVFNINDGKDKITDFNIDEDTLSLAGFGYQSEEELMANVVETTNDSILFNDQGTEIEIEGLNMIDAVYMDLMLFQAVETEGDMGAMRFRGGGGSWCCTASYKRGAMTIKEVKALRRWHVKQSRVWQEGYHIWGRIVADKWLMKSKWAAKGTQDLFNLIMHKKITFRGLLAWVVITPPAMLIGSYIVLSQKLDRLLGRSSVRGITG
jgi:hypothetical protein